MLGAWFLFRFVQKVVTSLCVTVPFCIYFPTIFTAHFPVTSPGLIPMSDAYIAFAIWHVFKWLRLSLSEGPNKIYVFHHLRKETDPISEMFSFLEFQAMGKVLNTSNSECHKPLTESFRIYLYKSIYSKNGVFWDVTLWGSCKNRRFGGTWRLLHQGDKNRWTRNNTSSIRRLLVAACVVPSSPILVTLMKVAPGSSET
jgi:hypothetical protein